ncbi:MAG TPA: hypothetical protein VH951_00210 [Dehalococcoidia bacterium]|jgi:hypothetical protein
MTTAKKTISVRLGDDAKRQVELAARLKHQSAGAFLESAGVSQAHDLALEWARGQYRAGKASASEVAAESGLAVEEIMVESDEMEIDGALDAFLAGCRAAAEKSGNHEFLRLSEAAVRSLAPRPGQARRSRPRR